jgi:hypothetical protein
MKGVAKMEQKAWYESTTIWAALLAVVGAIVPLIGMIGVEALAGDVVKIAGGLAAVIGGAVAIYRRYKATKILK